MEERTDETTPRQEANETEKERVDRELIELLNEIRVALPGVQVLFAFLLAVPFQGRWDSVTATQRGVYCTALCLSLAASALLIAPSAYHRINFRAEQKARLVIVSNRLTLAGIAALGLSMTCVLLLISDVLFGTPVALGVTAVAAATFIGLWVVLPILGKRAGPAHH